MCQKPNCTANCKQGFFRLKTAKRDFCWKSRMSLQSVTFRRTVSWDKFQKFCQKFTELVLWKGAACVGFIMLAAYFCPSRLSQGEYNCMLTKVDWLAACIALRVVGTVFVIFLWRWRTICTVLEPMGSKGRYLKKCPKPCWPIRIRETLTKYTPLSLLSQRKLAVTASNTLSVVKWFEQLKNPSPI